MKKLWMLPLLFLVGCSSLPAWMGGAKDTIEALVKVHAPGAYTVATSKDGRVLYSITWDCTVEAGQTLPECRKRGETPVPPNAAITPVK